MLPDGTELAVYGRYNQKATSCGENVCAEKKNLKSALFERFFQYILWTMMDSNHRPNGYEPFALTN